MAKLSKKTQPTVQPIIQDTMPSWKRQASTYLVGRSHLDGSDALALECERKWGVGRLRLLVDADLRARFDSQRLKLAQAMAQGELADVRREAERMANAWRALDAQASAQGAVPLSPLVWEVELPNGKVAALVRDATDAHAVVAAEGRAVNVYSLDEIANLIAGFPALVKTKEVFPGATVVATKPIGDPLEAWDEDVGDAIPFGVHR